MENMPRVSASAWTASPVRENAPTRYPAQHCVCGYAWCRARQVCSWAWTRTDATEGAFHVRAGQVGISEVAELNEFRRARQEREDTRRSDWLGHVTGSAATDRLRAARLIREYWGAPEPVRYEQDTPQWQVDAFAGFVQALQDAEAQR